MNYLELEGAQSFTSLQADLCQDINRGSAISKLEAPLLPSCLLKGRINYLELGDPIIYFIAGRPPSRRQNGGFLQSAIVSLNGIFL